MKICPDMEIIPVTHGKELFAREVRKVCSEQKFDCVAVDIPSVFHDDIGEAVDNLPLISALFAYIDDGYSGYSGYGGGIGVCTDDPDDDHNIDTRYYVPIDPCDPMIEGIRQARQRRIPHFCIGGDTPREPAPLPAMPDGYSITKTGFDAYAALCCAVVAGTPADIEELTDAQRVCAKLKALRERYKNILAIVHFRHFDVIKRDLSAKKVCGDLADIDRLLGDQYNDQHSDQYNATYIDQPTRKYTVITRYINTDHLYFALGELPFITAKTQMERHDPFAAPMDMADAVKGLFTETRDNYFDDRDQAAKLSPVRIQTALTYLRNLTVMSGRLMPDLFDIVEAAKGVGGNAFALRILKSAKYYPYLPIENDDAVVNVGIDRISIVEDECPGAGREVYAAVNLFRDTEMVWRTICIKPDPSAHQKKKYRYAWDARNGLYSHMPEDIRLESFNAHARGKAMRVVTEHLARTEKFTSSVKDGIDIRETLRNWHTGNIYVRELPPIGGKVDTVIIVFDEDHDERYPQQATWYAEHAGESTLSFYATEIGGELAGPGIARCAYGGVSLLFPPRVVPDIFEMTSMMGINGCAARLVAGSLMFSLEKNAAYIAAKAPSLRLRTLSKQFKKHLVWIPLSAFSTETINRLRHFHVLNGKNVRSWASRFIGDER